MNTVFTKAKMYVAAVGTTLTAVTTALAVVSVAIGDDAVSIEEISGITTALLTMGLTVWGVWRVPNQPIPEPTQSSARRI